MKKVSKILAVALCLTMLFTLVGCNKYGSISKAFENEGYKSSSTLEGINNDIAEALDGEVAITVHIFVKGFDFVSIYEFKSTKDIEEAMEKNNTLKGLIKDLSQSDHVNGNCVFISGSADALKIFQKA